MPGQRQHFEHRIEAISAEFDGLPADVRAAVLTQVANQLRTQRDDHR